MAQYLTEEGCMSVLKTHTNIHTDSTRAKYRLDQRVHSLIVRLDSQSWASHNRDTFSVCPYSLTFYIIKKVDIALSFFTWWMIWSTVIFRVSQCQTSTHAQVWTAWTLVVTGYDSSNKGDVASSFRPYRWCNIFEGQSIIMFQEKQWGWEKCSQ